MASIEGPAPSGGELFGGPAPSLMTDSPEPEVPKLTQERAQQELARLTAIIKDNPSLHFLEPRVIKCAQDGIEETLTFLSFYRLISQSLSEELVNQKERLKALESDILKARQVSAQSEMEQALAEASHAVTKVTTSLPSGQTPSVDGVDRAENSAQVDELLRRLDQAEIQRERLLQDMQNMRNRAKIDVDVKVFKAVEKFTLSLLPALDAFHQAMPTLQTATDTASIVTGIEMIHEQLQNALVQAGLKRMEVVGQKFDPRFHEAIGEVETWEVEDDHIYDELQPGYEFGERLIRAAVVRVARNTGTPPVPAAQTVQVSAVPQQSAEQAQAAPPPPPSPQAETPATPAPVVAAMVDAPTAPMQVPPELTPTPGAEAPAPPATQTVSQPPAPTHQPAEQAPDAAPPHPAPQAEIPAAPEFVAAAMVDAPTAPLQVPPELASPSEADPPTADTTPIAQVAPEASNAQPTEASAALPAPAAPMVPQAATIDPAAPHEQRSADHSEPLAITTEPSQTTAEPPTPASEPSAPPATEVPSSPPTTEPHTAPSPTQENDITQNRPPD